MTDAELPVPAQLSTQLGKCKTVRNAAEHHKSREKSEQVRYLIIYVNFFFYWAQHLLSI